METRYDTMMHTLPPRESMPPRLDEFMAAFEIAGCFSVSRVNMGSDDLESIPYGGSE